MRKIPLSELVISKGPKAKHEVDLPVYSVTKHDGFVPSLEYFSKQVFSRDIANYRVVEAGDFAYATIHLDEGSIGIAPVRSLISPMYTVFGIDSTRVEPRFLLAYLKSDRALAFYNLVGRGAIHRRRSISLKALGELLVPLPGLSEQRRIADILDKADALRAKRQKVLDNLDALTQSIFEEALKQGAYTFKRLGDLAEFRGGASLPSGVPYLGQQGGQLLMRVSDMNMHGNERFVLRTSEWGSEAGTKSALVRAHAVVLPKRGASIATNKKRLTVRPTLLDPNLMGVEPDVSQIRSEFLFAWFESFDLSTIASGSSVPQLNKKDLAPLQVPVPESDVQDCFVQNVRMVQRLRRFASDALSNSDELTQGLRSRLFNR